MTKGAGKIGLVSLIGFLVSIIAAFGLFSSKIGIHEPHFWYRITWTGFLAFLFWGYIGGLFNGMLQRKFRDGGIFGANPSLGVLILLVPPASFLLLVLQIYLPENNIIDKTHLPLQISLFSLSALYFIFLSARPRANQKKQEALPSDIPTPSELSAEVNRLHRFLDDGKLDSEQIEDTKKAVEALVEKLAKDFPAAERITQSKQWAAFTQRIQTYIRETEETYNGSISLESDIYQMTAQEAQQMLDESDEVADALNARQ